MRGTIKSRRDVQGDVANKLGDMVRRAVLSLATSVSRWQLSGHEGETFEDVPVYQHVGFASYPAAGQAVRAILLALGASARSRVAVASSSSAGRPDMLPGETAIFNSLGANVHAKANGDIVVRCKPGQQVFVDDGSGATALATLADLQALHAWLEAQFRAAGGHTHTVSGSATVGIACAPVVAPGPPAPPPSGATVPVPTPAGTAVLRAR